MIQKRMIRQQLPATRLWLACTGLWPASSRLWLACNSSVVLVTTDSKSQNKSLNQ